MTDFLLRIFVKDHKNLSNPKVREKIGNFGGFVGIFCNLVLFALKFTVGTLTASISVTADAFNNLSDMGSSVITLLGFKLANIPPDKEHPFGHGRIEYISATLVSAVIIFVGGELLIQSVKKIFSPTAPDTDRLYITLIILSVAIILKFLMSVFNKKLGKMISSDALTATAADSLSDCVATLSVLVTTVIFAVFKINLDAYAGSAVALFIIYSGVTSVKNTLNPLLGTPPKPETVAELKTIVMSFNTFLGIHDLIIHNYGPGRSFASLHIEVSDTVNIVECHEQIDLCEKIIKERMGIDAVIHMDPIAINDEETNQIRELVSNIIKNISPSLSFHDLRIVRGQQRTNVIFDVVVPDKFPLDGKQLKNEIQNKISEKDGKYVCVITFDSDYTTETEV